MEGPDQPRDRIRWRGERTTIERTRIATPHSSWIESYTETESTAIDELSLSPPAAADERSGISNQRTQPSDSPWPDKERKEQTGFAPATPKNFIKESPQEGQELFRPRLGEIFTQKYLQKSEWRSPFPKRNRQRRQKSTDGSRKCHIMTAQKHGIDDIGFIHSYIFESVSSLRS